VVDEGVCIHIGEETFKQKTVHMCMYATRNESERISKFCLKWTIIHGIRLCAKLKLSSMFKNTIHRVILDMYCTCL